MEIIIAISAVELKKGRITLDATPHDSEHQNKVAILE
jgi:hypothetical protein